jgi:hypothetical protein
LIGTLVVTAGAATSEFWFAAWATDVAVGGEFVGAGELHSPLSAIFRERAASVPEDSGALQRAAFTLWVWNLPAIASSKFRAEDLNGFIFSLGAIMRSCSCRSVSISVRKSLPRRLMRHPI